MIRGRWPVRILESSSRKVRSRTWWRRQRGRRGDQGQLIQTTGHERRCRIKHELAKCSWDVDTHMITEAVPAVRPSSPKAGHPAQLRPTPTNRANTDLATARGS